MILLSSRPINDQSIVALFNTAILEGRSITITAELFKTAPAQWARRCDVEYRTETDGPPKQRSAYETKGDKVAPDNVMDFGFDILSMQWGDPATIQSGGAQITGWGNGFTVGYFERVFQTLQLGERLRVDDSSMPPPEDYSNPYGPPRGAGKGKVFRVVFLLNSAYGRAKIPDFDDPKYDPLVIQSGPRAGWKKVVIDTPYQGYFQRSFPGNVTDPALGLTDKPY